MGPRKDPKGTQSRSDDFAEFCETFAGRLRSVPLRDFVSMVSRAGLTTAEARALCEDFRRLKA
jgi:hypothetical protein